MERAPLPPHERAWRHPSEVAAQTSARVAAEPVTTVGRTAALTAGALTLLVIGALVVTMSPERRVHHDDEATGASALLSVPRVSAVAVAPVELSVPGASVGTASSPPVVTPIGDGFVAVATAAAIGRAVDAVPDDDGEFDAVLPTGDPVPARVPRGDARRTIAADGLVIVQLTEWTPGAMELATDAPRAGDMVVVMTDPPARVPLDRVAEVGAADGTPVVDGDGHLVGLCSDDGLGRRVLSVSMLRDLARGQD